MNILTYTQSNLVVDYNLGIKADNYFTIRMGLNGNIFRSNTAKIYYYTPKQQPFATFRVVTEPISYPKAGLLQTALHNSILQKYAKITFEEFYDFELIGRYLPNSFKINHINNIDESQINIIKTQTAEFVWQGVIE